MLSANTLTILLTIERPLISSIAFLRGCSRIQRSISTQLDPYSANSLCMDGWIDGALLNQNYKVIVLVNRGETRGKRWLSFCHETLTANGRKGVVRSKSTCFDFRIETAKISIDMAIFFVLRVANREIHNFLLQRLQ